jgi:hypothetical protein
MRFTGKNVPDEDVAYNFPFGALTIFGLVAFNTCVTGIAGALNGGVG